MVRLIKLLLIFLFIPSLCFGAVDLSGANDDYIDIGGIGDLENTGPQYTCGVVFKTDSVATNKVMLGVRTSDQADATNIYIQLDHNNDDCRFLVRDDGGDLANATASAVLGTTNYHAAVGVRDGTTAYIYVDSSTANGTNASLGDVVGVPKGIIGNLWDDAGGTIGSNPFDGKIADVFIVEGAWTQAQAEEWINAQLKRNAKQHNGSAWIRGGYWPLDDHPAGTNINGITFNDISGTGHNGTGNDSDADSDTVGEEFLTYPSNPMTGL